MSFKQFYLEVAVAYGRFDYLDQQIRVLYPNDPSVMINMKYDLNSIAQSYQKKAIDEMVNKLNE